MPKYPIILLLIGEMGSGKSFIGKKLVEQGTADVFVEGDDLIPLDMREAVEKFGKITPEMLVALRSKIFWAGWMYTRTKQVVVISQALYREEDRQNIIEAWNKFGISVEVGWVKAGFWRNLKQLWSRPKGFRWVLYWLMSKPFFQKPKMEHAVMDIVYG